ncbi:MAG: patatin, partial [Rubrivivax sp.]
VMPWRVMPLSLPGRKRWARRLARLAVPPAQFAAWRRRLEDHRPEALAIDAIEITGLQRVNPEAVGRHLQQRVGQPLDTDALNRDLLRAYGDGWFEGVDYQLLAQRERKLLRITPVEKRWGPDYLRFAVGLNSNLSQGSTYALRGAYQKTWLNRLGAELLADVEIGSNTGGGIEFYQPLDSRQDFFVEALLRYRRSQLDVFLDNDRFAEYRTGTGSSELVLGSNLGLLGQLRLGWRSQRYNARLDTGLPQFPNVSERSRGWRLVLDLDQLNGLYFPSHGWSLRSSWYEARQGDYTKFTLEASAAWQLRAWVLGTRVATVSSPKGELPIGEAASLGGFLNLSGFANGQLLGDEMHYAHLRAERIIGRLPLGLRGDMRLGLALEAGKMGLPYTETRRTGWLNSAVLYLGGETPLGPVFLGVGRSSSGATNAYLSIGTP